MNKKIVYIIAISAAFTTCVSGCSLSKNNIQSTVSSKPEESITATEASSETPLPETMSSETMSDETMVNVTGLFTSDSPDLKAISLTVSGPMCTKLVVENSKKSYSDSLGEDYPQVEFNKDDKISAAGWWTDEENIGLQFWNLNNEKEVHFSIDGAKCILSLPETVFETVEVTSLISSSGVDYSLESMLVYEDAAVLNFHVASDDIANIPTIKLKTEFAEYMPASIDIDNSTGSVKILYLLEKSTISDVTSDIRGVICNNQFMKFE